MLDWLDDRTGYRAALHHLLEEPLPKGTGWAFTTGSALLFLLGVQLLTGVALTMYYVPAPQLAYDSVRFITDALTLGWLLRGLHFWGSTFIVLAAAIHMLRVFFFGSYKAPREVTWLTGVVAVPADPRVLAERLSAAVGSEGVLGDDGHDQHRAQHAVDRRVGGGCAARRQPSRRADARALVCGARVPAAGGAHRRSSWRTSR